MPTGTKVTGATADRPQLKKLLAVVGHGDVVIIAAVDRLSRDTTDLLVIARDLQKAGAGLRSLTPHQKRKAIKRRDHDGETLRSIGRSYNVSAATIARLKA
jgi:ribosome-interacting GTPase 1